MRIQTIGQIKKSDSFFGNLVDKNLGRKKLKISDSDRSTFRKSEQKNRNNSANFLNGLPELLKIDLAASILGVSTKTIYDWKYRCKQRNIPSTLFVKINRSLLIRTDILKEWIASQNPSLKSESK